MSQMVHALKLFPSPTPQVTSGKSDAFFGPVVSVRAKTGEKIKNVNIKIKNDSVKFKILNFDLWFNMFTIYNFYFLISLSWFAAFSKSPRIVSFFKAMFSISSSKIVFVFMGSGLGHDTSDKLLSAKTDLAGSP